MQPMYYIGLDVHKRKISYCVKDGNGRIHAEGSISATLWNWTTACDRCHSRGARRWKRPCSRAGFTNRLKPHGKHHLQPVFGILGPRPEWRSAFRRYGDTMWRREQAGRCSRTDFIFRALRPSSPMPPEPSGVHPQARHSDDPDIARSAEFLLDTNGTVRWANFTESYLVRARPKQVLYAADASHLAVE
jgi:hypothetical protein